MLVSLQLYLSDYLHNNLVVLYNSVYSYTWSDTQDL